MPLKVVPGGFVLALQGVVGLSMVSCLGLRLSFSRFVRLSL